MPEFHSQSLASVRRLCGRLLVGGAMWALWPRSSRWEASAALWVCLAAGCGVAAAQKHEPVKSKQLNRWFEAFILLVTAALFVVVS
jgi:hypothetical protein